MVEHTFQEDIILVLIPTVIGVFTSLLITNSWQKKKTKNEIKRKILSEYTNSVLNGFSKITALHRAVIMEYQYSSGKIKRRNNISSNKSDDGFVVPLELFAIEYEEFDKRYWDSLIAINQLVRSLRLYYQGGEKLADELVELSKILQRTYSIFRQLMTSNDLKSFKDKKTQFTIKENAFNKLAEDFEKKLIDENVIIK